MLCQPVGSFHTLLPFNHSVGVFGKARSALLACVSQEYVGEGKRGSLLCSVHEEERYSQNNLEALETPTHTSAFRGPKQNSTGMSLFVNTSLQRVSRPILAQGMFSQL